MSPKEQLFIFASICFLVTPSRGTADPKDGPATATIQEAELKHLATACKAVVEGKVISVSTVRAAKRGPIPVLTRVEIQVTRSLDGTARPRNAVETVIYPGGTTATGFVRLTSSPILHEGDELFLFEGMFQEYVSPCSGRHGTIVYRAADGSISWPDSDISAVRSKIQALKGAP